MIDIIERLREKRGVLDGRWPGPSELELEAANEIELLRRVVRHVAVEMQIPINELADMISAVRKETTP